MNFRDLDLNLLLVFNAIYSERSISVAAKKLGMSQPAVSNALRRLRQFTGDTLFYKSGSGVAPTRAAMTLALPIGHALDTVEHTLSSMRNFDPQTSNRVFRIGVADIIQPMVVPTLVSVVREEAPNVILEFVQQPGGRVAEALRNREIELGGLPSFSLADDIVSEPVWRERMVLIAGRNHPLARFSKVTAEQLNGVKFVYSTHLPAVLEFVEGLFRSHGIDRQRGCTVADTETIYKMVALSDLVAVVGRNFANHHNTQDGFVLRDLPFEMPALDFNLGWTVASDEDQGHRWLREHVLAIMRSAARLMNFETPNGPLDVSPPRGDHKQQIRA